MIDQAEVLRLQAFALTHPLAQAGTALHPRHFVDVHDDGIRVALSLNK